MSIEPIGFIHYPLSKLGYRIPQGLLLLEFYLLKINVMNRMIDQALRTQMKTLYPVTAAISLLVTLSAPSGAAENDVIKLDVQKSGFELLVTVVARTDSIQIKNIDVNRGRCLLLAKGTVTYQGITVEGWVPKKGEFTPTTMQFADGLTWHFGNPLQQKGINCSFVEARVFTNKGTFTISE
ncbi:hypothetical protein [Citrobacter freundii]|uniref:hypothetical protein n=2 Tax=Enterobacteriaceae TaxID=543 RepID=UPI001F3CFD2F|nr:hypothetical protein [Citrobacter freundii]MDT7312385.1 hypothetical protein [Citrobacter freundii]